MELGDFLKSINYDKKPLLDKEEKDEKLYPPFIVNKCLSYFSDTILYANEMNCNWHIEKKMQFDYLRLGIRKNKRFSPWVKKEIQHDIEIIKEVYGYTDAKAQEVLNILGPGDMDLLKKSLEKGGIDNKD